MLYEYTIKTLKSFETFGYTLPGCISACDKYKYTLVPSEELRKRQRVGRIKKDKLDIFLTIPSGRQEIKEEHSIYAYTRNTIIGI
jgi:hypothetical protein